MPSRSSDSRLHQFQLPDRFESVGRVSVEDGICRCDAHDALTGQDVHLRFVPYGAKSAQTSHNPILREYRVLSCLAHPSIPRLLDLVLEPSCSCLVLESTTGYSELARWSDGAWSADSFSAWLDSMLSVLDYIHGAGLIHCGLTPRSVLVHAERNVELQSRVRLVDFHHSSWQSHASRLPTFSGGFFLPPLDEQRIPSPSLDLYSVGALSAYVLSDEEGSRTPHNPDALSLLRESARPVSERTMKVLQRMVAHEESFRPSSVVEIRSQVRALASPGSAAVSRPTSECGLVPRRNVERLLRSAIARLLGGVGHILVLVGPQGVGKTLSGRIAEVEGCVCGCDFVSCCQLRASDGGVVLSEDFRVFQRDLGHLVRVRSDATGVDASGGRGASREFVQGPVLLFADDADELAKEDLAALTDAVGSAREHGVPSLLLLTCRDLPVDLLGIAGVSLVAGSAMMGELGAEVTPVYVRRLGNLTRHETALLLTDMTLLTPSSDLVDWVVRHTAGNPLFVRELTVHMTARSHLRESSQGLELDPETEAAPPPESVLSMLTERVLSLTDDELRVAEVVSLGPGITRATVSRIADLDRDRVDELIDGLVRCGVLRPSEPSAEQVFSHDLLRDTVYAAMPVASRHKEHEMAAAIWRGIPPTSSQSVRRDEVLAWHLHRCQELDSATGHALRAAAALVNDGRVDESLDYLHMLETLPAGALHAASDWQETLMQIARGYWRFGRASYCARACVLGIALASSYGCLKQPVLLDLKMLLARACVLTGDQDEATRILLAALAEAEQSADPVSLVKTY